MDLIKKISFCLLLSLLGGVFNLNAQDSWTDSESMVKAMEWQEQHPIIAIAPTDWTNGVYYTGVTKAYQETKDQRYIAALKTMEYRNQWNPSSRVSHADDICIAYSYLFINTTRHNLVDLSPTKEWLDKHLFQTNKWNENKGKGDQKILWWWADALFMAPPVIAFYAINNGLLSKKEYEPVVTKAWNALRKCQNKEGMVGWVQNIGASPMPANRDSWQNFGSGAFLLAGSEMLVLKKN